MSAWQSAAIALAIGLLIGSERERSGAAQERVGGVNSGVRTFALAALAGALAALVHPLVLAGLIAGAAVIAAARHLRPEVTSGTTTEIALVLTVVLGGLTVSNPALAAAAGVATAVLLLAKDRLHHFVRDKITELEMGDALKFFVAAFIVLPLVPHANLGPYGVIDPRRIWTFVVAVTALGWLGYVAVRLLGPGRGLPVAGLAGGFVSGAATTGAMARVARDPKMFRPAMAAALLASVATLVQLVLVTWVADSRVAGLLVPAVALGSAVLVAEAGWLVLRRAPSDSTDSDSTDSDSTSSDSADSDSASSDSTSTDSTSTDSADGAAAPAASAPENGAASPAVRQPAPSTTDDLPSSWEVGNVTAIHFGPDPSAPGTLAPAAATRRSTAQDDSPVDTDADDEPTPARPDSWAIVGRRPFALIPALILAGILTVFVVLAAAAEHALGSGGAVLAVAAAGLADAHAGALTAAGLASQGTLAPPTAVLAAMAAVGVNTVVKLVLAHVAGGRRASTTLAALFAAPIVAVALGLAITLGLTS
jgi:uncharacterized membrane protein (DUF4010 family)